MIVGNGFHIRVWVLWGNCVFVRMRHKFVCVLWWMLHVHRGLKHSISTCDKSPQCLYWSAEKTQKCKSQPRYPTALFDLIHLRQECLSGFAFTWLWVYFIKLHFHKQYSYFSNWPKFTIKVMYHKQMKNDKICSKDFN